MRRSGPTLPVLLACFLGTAHACAQQIPPLVEPNAVFTVGILQGGGSLVGVDIEVMLDRRFGIQVGGGFVGFGGGLNYHLKPGGRSSFISMQYWHQGIGDSFAQSVAGPNYVYRARSWFTAQVGIGAALDQGPAWPEDVEQPGVMLMYAIGAYFPW